MDVAEEMIPDNWAKRVRLAMIHCTPDEARNVLAECLSDWPDSYTVPRGYPATDIVLPIKKDER